MWKCVFSKSWYPPAGSWIVATTTALEALCRRVLQLLLQQLNQATLPNQKHVSVFWGQCSPHRLNLLRTGEPRNSSGYMCELCTLHPISHLKVEDGGPSHLCPGSAVIWGARWWNISQIFSYSGYWEGLMDVGSSYLHMSCVYGLCLNTGNILPFLGSIVWDGRGWGRWRSLDGEWR